LLCGPVPEHRGAKTRRPPAPHTDALEREVPRLVGLGATEIARHHDVSDWAVMNDPEGNEFCIVQPPPPEEPEDEE